MLGLVLECLRVFCSLLEIVQTDGSIMAPRKKNPALTSFRLAGTRVWSLCLRYFELLYHFAEDCSRSLLNDGQNAIRVVLSVLNRLETLFV